MHQSKEKQSLRLTLKGLFTLMRPRQWIKNAFVCAPLIFSAEFLKVTSLENTVLATVLFCLASSTAYIINDLADAKSDRLHANKSKIRPIASGLINIQLALILLAFLYSLLIGGFFIAPKLIGVIVAYICLNIAYTLTFKHQPVIDIFSIAIGFVLRVYAGAIAIDVPVSSWMFITTFCLALHLAAIKRHQELIQRGPASRKVLTQYSITLINRYADMSGICALIFYSMFVMTTKQQLMITVPLVLFGIFRYGYVVDTLGKGESPADAILADSQLLITILIWVGTCLWILYPR